MHHVPSSRNLLPFGHGASFDMQMNQNYDTFPWYIFIFILFFSFLFFFPFTIYIYRNLHIIDIYVNRYSRVAHKYLYICWCRSSSSHFFFHFRRDNKISFNILVVTIIQRCHRKQRGDGGCTSYTIESCAARIFMVILGLQRRNHMKFTNF